MNIILYFSDQQRFDTINEKVTPNLHNMLDESIFLITATLVSPFVDLQERAFKQDFMQAKTTAT